MNKTLINASISIVSGFVRVNIALQSINSNEIRSVLEVSPLREVEAHVRLESSKLL